MYKISARQILVIALVSAIFAATAVAVLDRISNRLQPSGWALSEKTPTGISDPAMATDETNNIEIYRSVAPGVVNISSTSYARDFFGFVEPQEGSGSGSIIDADGDIVTNFHVVEGAQKLSVSLGGQKTYAAKLIGGDPDTDLAVIRLVEKPREPLTIVALGDSEKLSVGQKVLAIGNPFSINPGNSGGPLLDSHGRMIGINSQILSPTGASAGVGFAIPVSIAKRIVPQLVSNGSVRRPGLGISSRNISDLNSQELPVSQGLLILQVTPGGPAASAGVHGLTQTENGEVELGDIIVGVDGEKINNSDDLARTLDKHQVGDTIKIEILRNGRRITIPVRLGEAPDSRRGIIRR